LSGAKKYAFWCVPPQVLILKDWKPSGQVAQVLSQMLTPFWTDRPQLLSAKVSMTKAEVLALIAAIAVREEARENFIL
jgi:hypothetical protein